LSTSKVELVLLEIARNLAAQSQARLITTTAELAELEEQARQLEARREGQRNAYRRLEAYQPRAGSIEYRCPNCWIIDGRSIPLKPILYGKPEDDILRCPACGRDFGISLRS